MEINWSYNGTDASSQHGVSVVKTGRKGSTLVIDTALASHRGNYTCTARNKAGTTHYTAVLNVHGIRYFWCFSAFPPILTLSRPVEILQQRLLLFQSHRKFPHSISEMLPFLLVKRRRLLALSLKATNRLILFGASINQTLQLFVVSLLLKWGEKQACW